MRRGLLLCALALSRLALAQSTPATGDSRTVTEPSFPAVCSKFAATKYVVQTNAVNIDPFNATATCTGSSQLSLTGSNCSGGTDAQPSCSAGSYATTGCAGGATNETLDNAAFQAALNACTSGKAVEVVQGASGQGGIVLKPYSIPTGVGIIYDAGIHVFASRNLSDWGGTNCGIVVSGSSSCNHWLTAPSTSGSGIYGYGILDGRAFDSYIGTPTQSFYINRLIAYCHKHGGTSNGSPTCPSVASDNSYNSYGPNGINLVGANNFTIYKVTQRDAGNFQVGLQSLTGFTAWDMKVFAPFEVSNTDGWDPLNTINATFTHGYISVGDNLAALKAHASATNNISFINNQTGAGIGLQNGTDQTFGITNVLYNNIVMNGNLFNGEATGIETECSSQVGGNVGQVTYSNICMRNEAQSLKLSTSCSSGTPIYSNFLLQNITVLPSTAPYTTGKSGTFNVQGTSSHHIGLQINNLHILGTGQGANFGDAAIYQGPGTVDSYLTSNYTCGSNGVTCSGSASSTTAYACSNSSWSPLTGELNIQTAASNNNQSVTFVSSQPFTLQAVLQPTTEISTKEQPALTASVAFYDNCTGAPAGCTPVGAALLTGDGFYAGLPIASVTPGTHNYFAYYPGDSHYSAFQFGAVTVINGSPTTPPMLKLGGTLTITATVY